MHVELFEAWRVEHPLIDVDDLTAAVDHTLRSGASVPMPTVIVTPRPPAAT